MPIKRRKLFAFPFQYEGIDYYYDTCRIFCEGSLVCNCDLTETEYYGDKTITLICCQIALRAYYKGVCNGTAAHKKEIRNAFQALLGITEG